MQKRSQRLVWSLLLVLALVASWSAAAFATGGSASAPGTVRPYHLALQALKGKSGTTDLYLSVSSNNPAVAVPDSLNKLQLKSFDSAGKLKYTRNVMSVPTPSGQGTLQLTDVDRGQPLKAQVNVKTAQTVNEEVLSAETKVQLRPDLTVTQAQAPAQVNAGNVFPVNVTISELNGDVGATATVQILHGATVLDTVSAGTVAAGGGASLAFALQFGTPGTYPLTVAITSVSPGDYDTTNNTASLTVTVVQPNQPVDYWAEYYNTSAYEVNTEGFAAWDGAKQYEYHYAEHAESFYFSGWTPHQINPAGTFTATLTSETGTTKQLTFTGVTQYSNNYDPANNAWLYVYSNPWGSYFYISHYAGDWSYSQNWYGWYGYSYGSSWGGPRVDAKSVLSVSLDFPDANGTHFGGNLSIGLAGWSNDWDYWWYDWWYNWNFHHWGTQRYFSGYSWGQTNW